MPNLHAEKCSQWLTMSFVFVCDLTMLMAEIDHGSEEVYADRRELPGGKLPDEEQAASHTR